MEFPVTASGDVVVPRTEGVIVYNPETGEGRVIARPKKKEAAAFAAASVDGKWIAWAANQLDDNGAPSDRCEILLTEVETGKTRELATASNACFIQLDPKGKHVSYSIATGNDWQPQLHIVDLDGGEDREIASEISLMHRWVPDGDGIVCLKSEKKDTNERLGSLVIYNVKTGKGTKIARVRDAEWFDLSPDAHFAVFSANAVSEPGKKLKKGDGEKKLYIVEITEGTIKQLEFNADFCRFSPKGDKMIALKDGKIWKITMDGKMAEEPLATCVSELENSAKFYPSWLSNDEVLVISKRAIFGVVGNTLELSAVNTETGKSRSLQLNLEDFIRKSGKKNGK